jgi:hypothetical protein
MACGLAVIGLLACGPKDQLKGTRNEEAQRLAEDIEQQLISASYTCESLGDLHQFPKHTEGRDGRAYLESLSLKYQQDRNYSGPTSELLRTNFLLD